jgi:hypothetical protein
MDKECTNLLNDLHIHLIGNGYLLTIDGEHTYDQETYEGHRIELYFKTWEELMTYLIKHMDMTSDDEERLKEEEQKKNEGG